MDNKEPNKDLVTLLRRLANNGKHERAVEIYARAADLEQAIFDQRADPKYVVKMWARARRIWCECTGEDWI